MMKFLKTNIRRHKVRFRKKIEFNEMNIDELLDIQYNQLPSRVERWTYEGSGWTIDLILIQQLVISEIAPCEGLPKELRTPMKR